MKLKKPLIKVCGMRNPQNIREVANLQPEMMGFIFFRGTKRFAGDNFVLPEISDSIEKVGVFVDEEPEMVIEILKKYRLQAAQLHGRESAGECTMIKNAGFKVLKAFGIDESFNWDHLISYLKVSDGFVFDTKSTTHGGSGKKFNWEILNSYQLGHPFLLSGGIRPEDAETLENFDHPQCIGFDINSGFETAPAFKDVKKLEQFFEQVRQK